MKVQLNVSPRFKQDVQRIADEAAVAAHALKQTLSPRAWKQTAGEVASMLASASCLIRHRISEGAQPSTDAGSIDARTPASTERRASSTGGTGAGTSRMKQTWDVLNMPIYVSPRKARERLGVENPKPGAAFFRVPESLSAGTNKTVALGPYASHSNPNGEAHNIGLLARASGKNPITNTGVVAMSDGSQTNCGLVAAVGGNLSRNASAGLAKGGERSENNSLMVSVGGEASTNGSLGISIGGERSNNGSAVASIGGNESSNKSLVTSRGGDKSNNIALLDAAGGNESVNMAAAYAGGGRESINAGALAAEGGNRSQNASFVIAKGGEASYNRSKITISGDGAINEPSNASDFLAVAGLCR